jgi:group I intron endonuclease
MGSIPYGVVYLIENTFNHKVYVGQTTQPPQRRWTRHKILLRNGDHKNPHLSAAWEKYGAEVFEFAVIEEQFCKDDLDTAEIFWIAYLRYCGVQLYNKLAGGNAGGKHTEETRRRMSLVRTGRKQTEETKQKRADAHRGSKRDAATRQKFRDVWITRKAKQKETAHPHRLQSPDGKIYDAYNLREFSLEHGVHHGNLCAVVNGKRKSCGGWKAAFRDDEAS